MTAAVDVAAGTGPGATGTLHVTKGHGTQNDFVLLDDRDGRLDLSAALVRALADRRAGVGGDGVIRLVGTQHVAEGARLLQAAPDARWFMDYRNADGSVAEMCGNGVRVFALYLDRLGLWDDGDELAVGTRSGVMRVRRVAVPRTSRTGRGSRSTSAAGTCPAGPPPRARGSTPRSRSRASTSRGPR